MSEVEVTMRRGNRLEISLAKVEKMLNDNQQDTVAAMQEAITMMARNRNTSKSNDNNTSTEEEGENQHDPAMEQRWWRRKEE